MNKLKNPPLKLLGLILLVSSIGLNVILYFKAGSLNISENLFEYVSYIALILGILIIITDFAFLYFTGRNVDCWADEYDRRKTREKNN
jgi:hypothetical protein